MNHPIRRILLAALSAGLLALPAAVDAAPDTTAPHITEVEDSPDPFTPNDDGKRDQTTIHWTIDERSLMALKIFTKSGTMLRDLMREHLAKGDWKLAWGGRDGSGHVLPSGTYVYKLRAEDNAGNRRVVKGEVTLRR
jgi:gliding motility-associated-like protein